MAGAEFLCRPCMDPSLLSDPNCVRLVPDYGWKRCDGVAVRRWRRSQPSARQVFAAYPDWFWKSQARPTRHVSVPRTTRDQPPSVLNRCEDLPGRRSEEHTSELQSHLNL